MANKEFKVKHGLIVDNGGIKTNAITVASLPAAAGNSGLIHTVSDALAPGIGAVVTGGGSVLAIVVSNGTNWIVLSTTVTGGLIGGTVAAGQVLYGTAAGVAGSEANLFWDAANDRLGVGTNAPGYSVHVVGSGSPAFGVTNGSSIYSAGAATTFSYIGSDSNHALLLRTNATERARFATSGNLLIGTTTDDGSNKLQVAGPMISRGSSGSYKLTRRDTDAAAWQMYSAAGNWSLYSDVALGDMLTLTSGGLLALRDPRATIGATELRVGADLSGNTSATTTQFIVRAGANQGSTALEQWQDSSGVFQARIQSSGGFQSKAGITVIDTGATVNHAGIFTTGFGLASNTTLSFSATTEATATKDASLSRQGPAVIQAGDGAANANGSFRGGFISQDGTTGVTVTTCTGFKNGLCISGT
jgi:hypothetical protein